MGQKLRDDKIGTLSHSSGVITMAASTASPSWLTIGGQQYKITSNLTLSVPALTANTLYMVYAVQTAGVVSLVQSTNVNSVGPAGYLSWKLIGAYYSNYALSFGGFTCIDELPRSQTISNGASVISAVNTPPTKGTVTIDSTEWYRDGEFMVFRMEFEQATAGTNGSGSYLFALPTNLVASPYASINNLTTGYGSFTGRFAIGIDHYVGHVCLYSTTQMFIYFQWQRESGTAQSASILNSGTGSLGAGAMQYGMNNVRIPIVGWSNTPLKDL